MRHICCLTLLFVMSSSVAAAAPHSLGPASRTEVASPPLSLVANYDYAQASFRGEKVIARLNTGSWALLAREGTGYAVERTISLEDEVHIVAVNSKGAYIEETHFNECQLIEVDDNDRRINLLQGLDGSDASACPYAHPIQLSDIGTALFITEEPVSAHKTEQVVFFNDGITSRRLISRVIHGADRWIDTADALLHADGRGLVTIKGKAFHMTKSGHLLPISLPATMSRKHLRPVRDRRGHLLVAAYKGGTLQILTPGAKQYRSYRARPFGSPPLVLADSSGRADGFGGGEDEISCLFGGEPASQRMDMLALLPNGKFLGYEDIFDSDAGRLITLRPRRTATWSGYRCQARKHDVFRVYIEGACTQPRDEDYSNFYWATDLTPNYGYGSSSSSKVTAYFKSDNDLDLHCTVIIKAPSTKRRKYAGTLFKVGSLVGNLDQDGEARVSSSPRELCGHNKIQAPYRLSRFHPRGIDILCNIDDKIYPPNVFLND